MPSTEHVSMWFFLPCIHMFAYNAIHILYFLEGFVSLSLDCLFYCVILYILCIQILCCLFQEYFSWVFLS